MADVSPDEVRTAVETGSVIAGAAGGFFAAVLAVFWKVHRMIGRFESLEKAEADRQKRDKKIDALLEMLSRSKVEAETRISIIERKLPPGEMMDAAGVWAVFNKQGQVLESVEKSIRHDMAAQHNTLRNELTDRMDDIKTDLRQVNDNLIKLVTRTPNSRATD